jgi:hypothetical protein
VDKGKGVLEIAQVGLEKPQFFYCLLGIIRGELTIITTFHNAGVCAKTLSNINVIYVFSSIVPMRINRFRYCHRRS